MRIVHIIDSLAVGGAEVLLVNSIMELERKYPEHTNMIVTLKSPGELIKTIENKVPYYNLGFKLTKLNHILKLRKILKNFKADIVHTHLLDSTLACRLILPSNIKLASTYHNVVYDSKQVHFSKWRLLLDKATYSPSYYSIFVSEEVAKNIKRAINVKNNHDTIVNFASPAFKPSYTFHPGTTLKLVNVGNLKPNKNHELAINVMGKLKDLPVSLDIYGEGDRRDKLQNMINLLGANVILKGNQVISSGLLAKYDAFLMTSHNEGMPVSLIEALATGMPSLLKDLPMLRETCGDAALYFKWEKGLIEMIDHILKNKNILEKLSEKAVERSSLYSVETYVSKLLGIYSKLYGSK